jgi:hypothetical protein
MAIQAVLTGDIVNSTRLGPAAEKKLLKALSGVLLSYRYEFYRGDSFQAYIKDAAGALTAALLCRTAAIGMEGTAPADVRISIGIGKTRPPGDLLGSSGGEAFVLSGRAFDELAGQGSRLVIASTNALANGGLQVIADYIDTIFKEMTGKQALVIFELLKGAAQQEVAAKLKKSKSTIHQHVTAGRWPEIAKLIQQYINIVNQLS